MCAVHTQHLISMLKDQSGCQAEDGWAGQVRRDPNEEAPQGGGESSTLGSWVSGFLKGLSVSVTAAGELSLLERWEGPFLQCSFFFSLY